MPLSSSPPPTTPPPPVWSAAPLAATVTAPSVRRGLGGAGRPRVGPRRTTRAGVFLLEVMLAVAVFALGVLALGRCLTNCLRVQRIQSEEARSRQAMENRMAEISASPALPDATRTRRLDGAFAGLTLVEKRRTLDLRNEQNANLTGLFEITLRTEWKSDGRAQVRTLSFYLLRQGT